MRPGLDTPAEVMIVGAGPSGLMMAAQLLRHGIQPVIIDSRQGPTPYSKALAVQARTLELYRQLGIVDQVVKEGKQAKGVKFHYNGEEKAELALNDTGEGYTPFPYILMYPQSKNEQSLLNYLTTNCCPVYWNTTFVNLQQYESQVIVSLSDAAGQYGLKCGWIIGADGAHSAVRHQLQIPFTGDTYPSMFYLADVILNSNKDLVDLYLTGKSFTAFFPMPAEGGFRVLGNLPDKLLNKEDLTPDNLLPYIEKNIRGEFRVNQLNWFTTYKLHHRMAEKFGEGRCFLVGDAAHIHSPVGGQGMNTGLQDAVNLSWKLAGVIKKQLRPDVLETYADERMEVAKELLKTTDRAFKMIMSRNMLARAFKKWLLPVLLKQLWKSEPLKLAFFKRVSQTGVSYPHSRLNLHLSLLRDIKAGDRLPYLKVYDEKKLKETDLHAWCSKPGFTLITMGSLQEMYLFTLAKWITQNHSTKLNFFHLPPSVKNQQVFDAFEVKQGQTKAIIVRPDMYIGLINDTVDIAMMDNYLRNVVGFIG